MSGETQFPKAAWRALVACGLGTALGPVLPAAASPMFTVLITKEFDWTRATQSQAILPAVLFAPLLMLLTGRLLDRFGVRRIVLPATFLYGFAMMSYALMTGNPMELVAIQMLVGLTGFAATGAAFMKTVSGWFPQHRGKAFAFLGAVIGVSSTLWVGVAALLLDKIGWRGAYIALGLTVLFISLPIQYFFLRERPGTERRAAKPAPAPIVPPVESPAAAEPALAIAKEGISLSQAFRTRAFWLLFGALAIDAFAMKGFQFHSAFYLSDRHMTQADVALLLGTNAAASVVGQLATGWFLDRYPSPRTAIAFFSCPLLGLLLITHAPLSAGTLAAAGILLGFGWGSEYTLGPFFSIGFFGSRSFSEIQSYKLAALATCTGLGSVAVGMAFQRLHSYEPVLLTLEILMAVCVLMVALLPRFTYKPVRGLYG